MKIVIPKGAKPCTRCDGLGHVPDPAYQGKEARAQRKKAGLSLREVARRMDFSVAYVGDLELGRRGWNNELLRRYLYALETK